MDGLPRTMPFLSLLLIVIFHMERREGGKFKLFTGTLFRRGQEELPAESHLPSTKSVFCLPDIFSSFILPFLSRFLCPVA